MTALPTTTTTTTRTPEPSPAGDTREREVPCQSCGAPTFNWLARCDDHLIRRCACGCGGIVTGVDRYLAEACFRADEPADRDELGPFD